MGNPSSKHKPQELTTAEKRNVEMGPGGWVRNPVAATGNEGSGADPEIIVAFRGTATIQGWISSFRWGATTYSEATPTAITVTAYCSENVTVVGSPTITVTNTKAGSGTATTITCTYASGTTTDALVFTSAVPSANQIKEDDILYIAANATTLAGGSTLTGADGIILITNIINEGLRGGVVTGGNQSTGVATQTDGPRIVAAA